MMYYVPEILKTNLDYSFETPWRISNIKSTNWVISRSCN